MSIELFTLLMFGAFFLLLAAGLPFAWTTFSVAIVFGFILQGSSIFTYFAYRTWNVMGAVSFIAIPLFVFMANMLRYSGIAEDLFNALYHWIGQVKGGLAMATTIVCTFLAAMVGTVGAGTTVMGLVALPAMLKRKYNKFLASGTVMAGGALGVMIPPSIFFIIYGINAGLSIGKLFIGGVGPGLVLAVLYITYIGIRCYLNPKLGPALPEEERIPLWQKLGLIRAVVLPFILIIGVLGSIYLGVATTSEAAGVGAMGAMICAAARRQLTWQNLQLAVYATLRTVGLIMWIVFGAMAFVGVFTLAGGDDFVSGLLYALPLGRWGILIVMQLILILLGTVLDDTGIVILTVPIFVPVITALGFDPLWFGVLFCVNMQVAFLSPPFGLALFYLKAVTPPEINIIDIYRAIAPFIVLQLIGLALCMVFPAICLWLPNTMIK